MRSRRAAPARGLIPALTRGLIPALVSLLAALAVAACGSSGGASGAGGSAGASGAGSDPGSGSLSGGTVPVDVIVGRQRSTVVLAPVYVNGKGPFAFVVDTGASRSIIDKALAQRLGFHISPSHAQLTGVNATHAAGEIHVSNWRIGRVRLPGETMLTLPLASDTRGNGHVLGGLVGSDNLSRFGSFRLDYRSGRLVLSP